MIFKTKVGLKPYLGAYYLYTVAIKRLIVEDLHAFG